MELKLNAAAALRSANRYHKLFTAVMEQHASKTVSNCLITNIYSYLETFGSQSLNQY
jgi:hypothetical protein